MDRQQSADQQLKTPITYYGGKQRLVSTILPLIPLHTLYVEPFAGGAAIFFAKEPSASEILNDSNSELINFYKIASCKFAALKKEIELTLHSRGIYNDARVIYTYPHLFTDVKRAWALWVLCSQGFSAKINGGWGFTGFEFFAFAVGVEPGLMIEWNVREYEMPVSGGVFAMAYVVLLAG